MKTIIALGVSAAALLAVSSVANAQSDCVNGWHMIKDQILVRCDELPSAFSGPGTTSMEPGTVVEDEAGQVVLTEPTPMVEEPLYTGSINAPEAGQGRGNAEEIPSGNMQFVAGRDECQPGYFWMMELNSGNLPVACE